MGACLKGRDARSLVFEWEISMRDKLIVMVSTMAIGSIFIHQAQARFIGGVEVEDETPPRSPVTAQLLPGQPLLDQTLPQQTPGVASGAPGVVVDDLDAEEAQIAAPAMSSVVSTQLAEMTLTLQAILARIAGDPQQGAVAAAQVVDPDDQEALDTMDTAVQAIAASPELNSDEKKQTETLATLIAKVRQEYKRVAPKVEKETKRVVQQVVKETARVAEQVENWAEKAPKKVEKWLKKKF